MYNFRNYNSNAIPLVVKNLLILNILLFVITKISGYAFNLDLNHVLGLHDFRSDKFSPYQFVTHMFMHANIAHIFFNMFALWMFGRVLENVWGGKRFFLYYIITGLGAAFIHIIVNYLTLTPFIESANQFLANPDPESLKILIKEYFPDIYNNFYSKIISPWESNPQSTYYIDQAKENVQYLLKLRIDTPTIGASGAVFGILLGFGMLFPNARLMLLFPPIPIKAKHFVIIYGIIELYLGLTQPGSNIAHFAHLGGMIFGFILIKYWNSKRDSFY